jgi:hypothetical protein
MDEKNRRAAHTSPTNTGDTTMSEFTNAEVLAALKAIAYRKNRSARNWQLQKAINARLREAGLTVDDVLSGRKALPQVTETNEDN